MKFNYLLALLTLSVASFVADFIQAEDSIKTESSSWSVPTDTGTRKTISICGVETAFRWCPPGKFRRSDFAANGSREIKIDKGFWLAEIETTKALFNAVVFGASPSEDGLPITDVEWGRAAWFVKKLNDDGYAPTGYEFRLPTADQWEYASRAGATNDCCDNLADCAWYDSNSNSEVHKVGVKEPNAWGFYDMCGNVWEWSETKAASELDEESPTELRVICGGSLKSDSDCCRYSYRGTKAVFGGDSSCFQLFDVGFRLALTKREKNAEKEDDSYEDAAKKLAARYRKSAESGDPSAIIRLGKCYAQGVGVNQDRKESEQWFRKILKFGDSTAMFSLANCYYNGLGVERDLEETITWLLKAVDAGSSEAMLWLGGCYYHGEGVEKDFAEAVNWFRKAAEAGNTVAMFNLGDCYYNGEGVEKDFAEAVNWFRKAAEAGNTVAMFNLGECYRNGEGIERDLKEALNWLQKSAAAGNSVAMLHLGSCYYNGEGVEQDFAEAVKWFRKAAEAGSSDAMSSLGSCYAEGIGVEQDFAEAVNLFRIAAEAGSSAAMCNLGLCYKNGAGVEKNFAEAAKWYRKAAEAGSPEAAIALELLKSNAVSLEGFLLEPSPSSELEIALKLLRNNATYLEGFSWEPSPSRRAGYRQTLKIGNAEYRFVWIPAGEFDMGSPFGEDDRDGDEVLHHVRLTKGFWMLETEVSQALYQEIMGTNPSHFKGDYLPVERVSWYDAMEFCEKLTTRLSDDKLKASLPTEAQWEYACRAGTRYPFWFGYALNGDKANCAGIYPYGTNRKGVYLKKTTPNVLYSFNSGGIEVIKRYASNLWGLYHMHGNVWEWQLDYYGDYPTGTVVDPKGPETGSEHVIRGGSWNSPASLCRSANRGGGPPDNRGDFLGFRFILSCD